MIEIRYGNIYLVSFDPSMGKEYQKVRPALVIQSDEITGYSPLVTVMPISSKIERKERNDIIISKDEKKRLLSDSVIKTHQLSSFDKRRVVHLIGVASADVLFSIKEYLKLHFSL